MTKPLREAVPDEITRLMMGQRKDTGRVTCTSSSGRSANLKIDFALNADKWHATVTVDGNSAVILEEVRAACQVEFGQERDHTVIKTTKHVLVKIPAS